MSINNLPVYNNNLFKWFGDTNSNSEDKKAEKKTTDNPDMTVVAHRGYSSEAPENTIPAFELAAKKGFDTVECDIEWTKDSVPVILHDSTINRTAKRDNGWGFFFKRYCSDYTYDELQKYDFGSWMSDEYKGTKIPSFYDLLECSQENDLNLYIELKKDSDFDEKKAKTLVDAVEEAGLEDRVTWISFEEDYLEMIDDLMPDSRLGYISKKEPTEETIDILENLDTDKNEVFLDVKAENMSEEAGELLKDAGFSFEAWTVDEFEDLDDIYSYGCTGITTNTLTEKEVNDYLSNLDD